MAELRDSAKAGVRPDQVVQWIELALYLADRILRLFGRRTTDRPERHPEDAEQ